MNIGMLWFDNDPKTDLSAKIVRASAYYRNKYGQAPNLCLVHPSEFVDTAQVEGMTIKAYKPVLPKHYWIGVERE